MTNTLDALVESLEKRALVMTDDPVYRRALDSIAALRAELVQERHRYMNAGHDCAAATIERDTLRAAFDDRVRVIEMQLKDNDALRAEVEACQHALHWLWVNGHVPPKARYRVETLISVVDADAAMKGEK